MAPILLLAVIIVVGGAIFISMRRNSRDRD